MPLKEFWGAIDVGGTKIASALFTPQGEIQAKVKVPIAKNGGDAVADQILETIFLQEREATKRGERLAGIGISVPGVVYSSGLTVWAPNIPGWDRFPLRDRITREEGIPLLVIDSDRSAYVMGEAWKGAAQGARDTVFLAVGTGIGAGILSGGRLIRGSQGIAGAVGWFGLAFEFKEEYAVMGCFEAEASGNSLARKARTLLEKGRRSAMLGLAGGTPENLTAEIVVDAARKGDPAACEVVDDAVIYLAMGIANIVSFLNPEVVVLGGGLFQAADVFLEPVRREFRRWAQPLAAETVRIEPTALGEDAGLYGCARLAIEAQGEE